MRDAIGLPEDISGGADPRPFTFRDGTLFSRGRLWSDVRTLAEQLPDYPYVFNLCEDRYLFCLVLLAAMERRQICLLPPSGQPGILKDILRDYPRAYLASEREPEQARCRWFAVRQPSPGVASEPYFDPDQTPLIAFTSGSTGRPKPCFQTWRTFRLSAEMAVQSLGLGQQRLLIVCTTPPQHMYGLETSIFWPLFSSLVMHAGRPFFPEDIRRLVEFAPWPCLLVSTPIHLRSLVMTQGQWSNLAGVLCSTAPLSETLARQTESVTGAPIQEIYGSTETLSFASRATARETLWRPYAGARLTQIKDPECTRLISPHLKRPAVLQDVFRIEADGSFAVLGRSGDMVKIGGKRASLAELNRRLTDIGGVDDGLFFVLEEGRDECRMGALVVSRLDRQTILRALRLYVDEVFLPRRLHFVAEIPRNEVGKVVKAEMERLLASLKLVS
jgi:acyl-coenzyme A synthetase/AMP-(fatty) acid ligase